MNKNVAVVAHDAGGAELLAYYVKNKGLDACYVLDGPAVQIFRRVLGRIENLELEDAIDKSDWVLTGSSWQSDLEWRALCASRARGEKSVTFLDHWGNFRERFVRSNIECLPDCLWVADHYAEQMALKLFSDTPIKCVGNPYLDNIKKLAAVHNSNKSETSPLRILIVTEPISEHALQQYGDALYHGYSEFDAVENALTNVPKFLPHDQLGCVIVRPHPSELPDKYEYLSEKFPELNIVVRQKKKLLDELLESDVVIGCETMALVAAIAAGKRVISCIPAGGRKCILPHGEIEHIRNISHR